MSEKKITLSIETAVQGGSLSLLRGNSELDYQIGARDTLNSEDILDDIKKILERNEVGRKSIKKIVLSRGPGSYTGVRVGMAVGLGLKKALDCEIVGASTLEAMVLAGKMANLDVEEVITAVPIGRNQICWQNFKIDNLKIVDNQTLPKFSTIAEFLSFYCKSKHQSKKMILHRKLYLKIREMCENQLADTCNIIDAGENIALLIGMAEAKTNGNELLHPIYIRGD